VSGEERDLEQTATTRVTDRDLLWVESVSERLLGHSAPRAWERAFFRPETSAEDGSSVTEDRVSAYFAEGDADWRQDLEPEFSKDDLDDDQVGEVAEPGPAPQREPDLVIDLTQPVRPQPPEPPPAPGRIDDEILRLALASGDTVLATAVLLLLEDRSRDRQRLATLETALRALIEQVDRIDGPDPELAVTARLLRRVVEY
jgi:hypothetical protein